MNQSNVPDENPFLIHINFQLSNHPPDTELNVKKLLRLVGMRRTRLHEKLRKETGMSTTAYIRFFRLHQASELLVNSPDLDIQQIAAIVGFNHQSYFTRRFQQLFLCPPSQFRKKSTMPGSLEHL